MGEKYYAQPPKTQSHFSQVPSADIERSKFDRSHGHKTTFNSGLLIPVYVDEVLPGDTFEMSSTAFARLSTPLKPIMDNLFFDTHYFFVPNRLVWDDWEKFCGAQDNPDDSTVFTVPLCAVPLDNDIQYINNYMGVPKNPLSTGGVANVSALPSRAYKLIWNEWYRDQNLQDSVAVNTASTDDGIGGVPLRRGKRHDYFTSCLPWPQKGSPVYIPIADTAPVIGNAAAANMNMKVAGGTPFQLQLATPGTSGNVVAPMAGGTQTLNSALEWGNNTGLIADLSVATAITINDLRTAFQIQRLLERDARGGTRYREVLLSHFGVSNDDGRLQRPEYLGGGTQMLNINPIAQTVATPDSPQANLAGIGTVVAKAGFNKSFTEHGHVIGLVSVRADLTYQNGLERFWSRQTRYDFYWPALSHLGEQPVYNREICTFGFTSGVENVTDKAVFGYQERYAEYRYKPSRITGKFFSGDAQSLDVWHLAQDFAIHPVLGASFIEENPPIPRIVAVVDEPEFLLDMWFSLQCSRPMPVYSVPGLIDHF